MKTLLLIRHAKSDWSDSSLSDFDRTLNKRGQNEAPEMAELVLLQGIEPEIIISSPAVRAKSTAEIFAAEFDFPFDDILLEQNIYSGSYKDILNIIYKLDDNKDVAFLFGHNPDITYLASHLSGNSIDNMPTSSVVCIDFKTNSWKHIDDKNGTMRFFEYPRRLRR